MMTYFSDLIDSKKFEYIDFLKISDEEKEMIWDWRNHESIRKLMFNSEFIKLQEHLDFLNGLKNKKDKRYWMVVREGQAVGVSSLINIKGSKAEWGYYLAPKMHEMNISVEFYFFTLNQIFDEVGMKEIYGLEKTGNRNANSLNTLFGFSEENGTMEIHGNMEKIVHRKLTVDQWESNLAENKRIEKFLRFTAGN